MSLDTLPEKAQMHRYLYQNMDGFQQIAILRIGRCFSCRRDDGGAEDTGGMKRARLRVHQLVPQLSRVHMLMVRSALRTVVSGAQTFGAAARAYERGRAESLPVSDSRCLAFLVQRVC